VRVEIRHLGCDTAGRIAGVAAGDQTHAAAPLDQPVPEGIDPDAQRRDQAHAGDDDPLVLAARIGPGWRRLGNQFIFVEGLFQQDIDLARDCVEVGCAACRHKLVQPLAQQLAARPWYVDCGLHHGPPQPVPVPTNRR
jgi:hypothetical protein